MWRKAEMDLRLEYHNGFLCVLVDRRANIVTAAGPVRIRKLFPIRKAAREEVAAMLGRPLKLVDPEEGLYVDEDGEAFSLERGGDTEALEVEIVRSNNLNGRNGNGAVHTDLEASANGRLLLTYRGDDAASAIDHSAVEIQNHAHERAENDAAHETPVNTRTATAPVSHQLSLKQKLAEVRRRIGQIEKRGINHEGNYNYVRAADLSGAVGDVLAELGVIMLPHLESISSEPLGDRAGGDHLTRVVIAYTFMDTNNSEELTVKVAGEGVDPGDKSVCKAQTSALKYALLQSFLIATGDDPEEDCGKPAGSNHSNPLNRNAQRITAAQAAEIRQLVERTGTEL